MIETVRLIGDLGSRAGDLRELNRRTMDWRRVGAPGGSRWVAQETPEGVGSLSIVTQGKSVRWEAEGNLTACLYGEQRTAGGLQRSEVVPALGVMVERAIEATLGAPVPRERDLRLNRVDFSRSLVLTGVHTSGLLLAAAGPALDMASNAHPVNLIKSGGVTLALGKRGGVRYRRFYEKYPEAQKAGKNCPPNTLRMESETRTAGGACRYLEEVPEMVEKDADAELMDMARWLVEACANYNLATIDMLRQGMRAMGQKDDSAEAMRLAGAASVLSVYGVQGLMDQGGVSRATAFRTKARIHDLIVAAYGSEPEDVLRGAIETARVLLASDIEDDGDG